MSYHDLYITTDKMPRTRLCDMPYGYEVSCNRVGGWCLWRVVDGVSTQVAGEYGEVGLRLDVNGQTVVDSRRART